MHRRTSPRVAARLGAPLVALLLLVAPRPARAAFHLGLEAVTDAPLDIGGKLWLELPLRLRLNLGIGVLPGAYVDAANTIGRAAGAYDDATAQLLRVGLDNALVARLAIGWRPFSDYGFYFDIGYGYVALGGGKSGPAALAALGSNPLPPGSTMDGSYQVSGKLHMLHAEIGYMWHLTRILTLRLAGGFAYTFASTQDVTPGFTPATPDDARAQADYSAAARDALQRSRFWTPTVSLAFGFQPL